jgi:hypothetical protein
MALIISPKVLEPLIPETNDLFFMSKMTHTPDDVLNRSNIYAIVVNNNIHAVTAVYRVSFSLLSATNKCYLFINNASKELTSSTPYISADVKAGKKPRLEDWDFKRDKIGLYAVVGLFKDSKIYFATSSLDVKYVRDGLQKEKEISTVITETVYV